MKPIYFPYTFIPSEVAEAGAACFGKMIVYHPSGLDVPEQMAASEKQGMLDIRARETFSEDHIHSALNDYKQWALTHADRNGVHLAKHGQRKEKIPFFDESSIMKIKEDIQRKIRHTGTVSEGPNSLFSSIVFLHMAHEFDVHQHDIYRGLRQLDTMERDLMKNLQGEEAFSTNGFAAGGYSADDPFDYMIPQRIEAWSGFMLDQIEQTDMSGLFITSNRSVFTFMTENAPPGQMVYEDENIPIGKDHPEDTLAWRDAFMEMIQRYVRDPWPAATDERFNFPAGKGTKASLSLYIVPGETPVDLFARFYPYKRNHSNGLSGKAEITNTLIGLFENSL